MHERANYRMLSRRWQPTLTLTVFAATDYFAGGRGAVKSKHYHVRGFIPMSLETAKPAAASNRRALWALAFACSVVVGVPAVRALLPARPATAGYRIVVSSGNPVVPRGKPLTLTAFADRFVPGSELPTTANVILGDAVGAETTQPMMADGRGAFFFTHPGPVGDFRYRVDSGPASTDWFKVTVADPVELTSESWLAVEPPAYAIDRFLPRMQTGLEGFEAPQHAAITLALRFTRPPANAFVEWQPTVGPVQSRTTPVRLSADRLCGTVSLYAEESGTLKVVLVGERTIRTEVPAAVRVIPDTPPLFETAVGLVPVPRQIRPNDKLPLDLVLTDDFGVTAVLVEYRVNDDPARSEALALPALGGRTVAGTAFFDLPAGLKVGDTVRVRVRIRDTRSVPALHLGTQEAVYPAAGWSEFRVTASARPLMEQELAGQRDRLKARLAAVREPLGRLTEAAERLRNDAGGVAALSVDHSVRLGGLREIALEIAAMLADLERELNLAPDFRPFAAELRTRTVDPLHAAATRWKLAALEVGTSRRDGLLASAARTVAGVDAAVRDLATDADSYAAIRLDARRLDAIADDQRKLTERFANRELDAAAVLARQFDLATRLRETLLAGGPLTGAADRSAADELRRLASELTAARETVRRIDAAVAETREYARKGQFEELARRQSALTESVAAQMAKLELPARLAGSAPLARDAFASAAKNLAAGQPVDALTDQEIAARELDKLADALERAALARQDEKESLRLLALWQADLRSRAADSLKPALRKAFAAEQADLAAAVESLPFPPGDGPLSLARVGALTKLARAATAVAEAPVEAIDEPLKEAAAALAGLADDFPTREVRLKEARSAVETLRKDLEQLVVREANEILLEAVKATPDAAARAALAKKLATSSEAQAELAKRWETLDLPGLEHRRTAIVAVGRRAASDLKAGLPFDSVVSVKLFRRHGERIAAALAGNQPLDERAIELANLQRTAATAAAALPATPGDEAIRAVRNKQRDALRLVDGFVAPGELVHFATDVKEAVLEADKVARPGGGSVEDLRKRTAAAASACEALAARIAGTEPDLVRIERLATERAEIAARVKKGGRIVTAADNAEAIRKLGRDAEDLDQTRVGASQAAKKKAVDALAKLRQASEPEREPIRQQAVADALRTLADEMKKHGEGLAAEPIPAKLPPAGEPSRWLPTAEAAAAVRELARQQRSLRDLGSKAAAELGAGTTPSETDPLRELAELQADLAKRSQTREKPKAVRAATSAADALAVGNPMAARKLATEARAEFAGADLVRCQTEILVRLESTTLAGAAARQQAELQRAAGSVESLAERFDRAAAAKKHNSAAGDATADKLAAVAEALRGAKQELERAHRETAAARSETADAARRDALLALDSAVDAATASVPKPVGPAGDATIQSAVDAIRSAESAMAEARRTLKSTDADATRKAMTQATDSIARAATLLRNRPASERHRDRD